MASTLVLLVPVLLVSLVTASHHFGGTATFTYRGQNPDGSHRVDIRNRETFDGCNSFLDWDCYRGDCGVTNSTRRGVVDESVNSPETTFQWCETETVVRKTVQTDKPFQERAASCCWMATRNMLRDWRLLTLVDLGTRSDTRKPNRSPDIAILPFLRVPENCPRTYNLISSDPDDDQVRCRHGTLRDKECGGCNPPSGFHLDQDSCTLHYYNASASPSVFGFELVVEDFPRRSITLTYSDGSQFNKAPLPRFRRRRDNSQQTGVDPPAPSCQYGDFLPKLVDPTPQNGARLSGEVNKELEIKVKAYASKAKIQNVILSGPQNISKHKNTQGEFVIRWTPTADDEGSYHPICFVVEAVKMSAVNTTNSSVRVYQSEMRCIVVNVRSRDVESHVVCRESTMTVHIVKSTLHGLTEDHLKLSDSTNTACSLKTHSNSTHVIAVVPLNACGTQIEEDDEFLTFKNEITSVDKSTDLITRKHQLEVNFCCQYPKRGNVTLSFKAHRENVTVWEKGYGTFTYNFEFYPDNLFQQSINADLYPLEYYLQSRIYMQIEAKSSLNNTELFIDSCSAAPFDNPNYQPTYPIIENGCKVDPTVEIYTPDHNKQFRFSMKAFKFIGLYDQVYVTCSVLMCEAGNPNTRASQGCINSTWTSGHHHIGKRETVIQSTNHFISQGPLRLRRSVETPAASVTNPGLNLNLVFIAGCLLAVIGMICGVVTYKVKMSKVNYKPLLES
uniref:ZP domain-containing protein n=1 Tax=Seriola dumerili TaxID=41447 RepID=A0A3B4TLU0_SERDU